MLNFFAKFLLVATSLSPILGAIAINSISNDEEWWIWGSWLLAAVALIALCWLVLLHASKHGQEHLLTIERFESNDKEVLAFLLAYLLPFISSENMAFEGEWLTGAYIIAVIFLVVAHAGAFHFNPVMGLLGYHFYGVTTPDGVSHVLISRKDLNRPGIDINTVVLARNVYLQV